MRAPFRKWLTLLCFLLVLGVLVASGSRVLDKWILILVWSAFLIGSVILFIKNARRPPESRGFYFGQAALLPRSWQRWIAGEEGPPDRERQ
jgi:Mn2+/Fe2+ NRAMP family transporter